MAASTSSTRRARELSHQLPARLSMSAMVQRQRTYAALGEVDTQREHVRRCRAAATMWQQRRLIPRPKVTRVHRVAVHRNVIADDLIAHCIHLADGEIRHRRVRDDDYRAAIANFVVEVDDVLIE